MTILIPIVFMAFALACMYLDVFTTKRNQETPKVVDNTHEKNDRYRLPNGDANMNKLIIDKFILFAITFLGSSIVTYAFDDFRPFPRSIAFLVFFFVGLRHLIVARTNNKLYNKFK